MFRESLGLGAKISPFLQQEAAVLPHRRLCTHHDTSHFISFLNVAPVKLQSYRRARATCVFFRCLNIVLEGTPAPRNEQTDSFIVNCFFFYFFYLSVGMISHYMAVKTRHMKTSHKTNKKQKSDKNSQSHRRDGARLSSSARGKLTQTDAMGRKPLGAPREVSENGKKKTGSARVRRAPGPDRAPRTDLVRFLWRQSVHLLRNRIGSEDDFVTFAKRSANVFGNLYKSLGPRGLQREPCEDWGDSQNSPHLTLTRQH